MKVLLIIPTYHYPQAMPLSFSDFPSGFGYLAATLKQAGHEVIGLNPNNLIGYPSSKMMLNDVLSRKIKDGRPDVIALGGLCTDYAFLHDSISISRHISPQTPVILGGQIVSNDAEFIFQDLQPDYAIKGEADYALPDLVSDMAKGSVPPGILKAEVIKNLDELPFPDYEPFDVKQMLDNYSMATRLLYRYSRQHPRPFIVVASRSCPFNCTFCIHTHRDIPYRARSVANIMAEIKQTYERYKFNVLIILDELFAVNKQRMTSFCQAVTGGRQQYGWDFDWMFQTHASARLDLESLQMAKQAGCFFFSYGLESASPVVLQSMNKKIKVSQVIEAMELARQAKVGFGANLIFGDPAETEHTWAESLDFWLRYGQDNFTFLAMLASYPGSKLFADCQQRGLIPDKHQYYETIDKAHINMTQLDTLRFNGLVNLTGFLEQSWLFVRQSTKSAKTPAGEGWFDITAECPYCGHVSMYREFISAPDKPFFLGTGCQSCNRRMRVDC